MLPCALSSRPGFEMLSVFVCFEDQARHLDRFTVFIDRHEHEKRRIRVRDYASDWIFGQHFDSDLHARAPDVVHARIELDNLAYVYRRSERHRIYAERHAGMLRMPHRTDRCDLVDELHDDAAVDRAEHVRVLGHHELV
jgi:hypothetical protein